MKRFNTLTNLAPALLLAAALGMAGCSQSDDTPITAGTARGGEPLLISVASKPGFADAATRGSVADDGTFAWEAAVSGGRLADMIYVYITFNDAAATTLIQTWVYDPGAQHAYVTDWRPTRSWSEKGNYGDDPAMPTWPAGATQATVRAFYTDAKRTDTTVDADGSGNAAITWDYSEGTGDYLIFTGTIPANSPIVIDFKHDTNARILFKGLTPDTEYKIQYNLRSAAGGGNVVKYPTKLIAPAFTLSDDAAQTFRSDAAGNLAICTDLNKSLTGAMGWVEVELLEVVGGTTVAKATLSELSYDFAGRRYTVNLADGGPINPDDTPDLMKPAPITPGNGVYLVQGYWVTAPDADATKHYGKWSSDDNATEMENNPCKGHGSWHLPTIQEFEVMWDLTTTRPWSETVALTLMSAPNSLPGWRDAFDGDIHFWSSTVVEADKTQIWTMSCEPAGIRYYKDTRDGSSTGMPILVRCVQKKL